MTYFEKFYRLRYWILVLYLILSGIIFIRDSGWQIVDEAKDLFEKIRRRIKKAQP